MTCASDDAAAALLVAAESMSETERCLVSMTCKAMRRSLSARARRIDAAECLAATGFRACREMGCPSDPRVCDLLARAGDDRQLVLAADAGCPVTAGVAAAAAASGRMDLLAWASSRGAAMDRTVAGSLDRAPPNVVKWLRLQGCPVHLAIAGMAAAGNVPALAAVGDSASPADWARALGAAARAGQAEAADHIFTSRLCKKATRPRQA